MTDQELTEYLAGAMYCWDTILFRAIEDLFDEDPPDFFFFGYVDAFCCRIARVSAAIIDQMPMRFEPPTPRKS